jgi:hypothetical protein
LNFERKLSKCFDPLQAILSQVPKAAATIAPARATTPTIALTLIESLTPPLEAVAAGASVINERKFKGCLPAEVPVATLEDVAAGAGAAAVGEPPLPIPDAVPFPLCPPPADDATADPLASAEPLRVCALEPEAESLCAETRRRPARAMMNK